MNGNVVAPRLFKGEDVLRRVELRYLSFDEAKAVLGSIEGMLRKLKPEGEIKSTTEVRAEDGRMLPASLYARGKLVGELEKNVIPKIGAGFNEPELRAKLQRMMDADGTEDAAAACRGTSDACLLELENLFRFLHKVAQPDVLKGLGTDAMPNAAAAVATRISGVRFFMAHAGKVEA